MNLGEIFKEGLTYPTNNWVTLIVLGVILTIISLIGQARAFTDNGAIIIIAAIVSFILAIFVVGYKLSIISEGIKRSAEIPLLDVSNFIDGINSVIVSIVYYIIPVISVTIVTVAISFPVGINDLNKYTPSLQAAALNPASANQIFAIIPPDFLSKLFTATMVVVVIAAILFFIFSIFALVAQGRLAETGSIKEAVSIGSVIGKVGEIGWLKIIAFLIIFAFIAFFILFVAGLVSQIPFIGVIISSLIFVPFLFLFQYYSIGLLYNSE